MSTVFAGFWVSIYVRKPMLGVHAANDLIVCKSSLESRSMSIYKYNNIPDGWYWLDTTKRKELTPEELYATIKVTRPDLSYITKSTSAWQFNAVFCNAKAMCYVDINWGDMTEYPSQKKWIKVTKENVVKYMFKPCRYGCYTNAKQEWLKGTIAGWNALINCCLIATEQGMVGTIDSVEVLEE